MRRLGLALLLLLAACGGEERSVPSSGQGPGISIEKAISAGGGEPLLVNGSLLAEGDEVRFCSALAESFPPQCGGPFLRVEGLDLKEVDGLTSAGNVSWSDRPMQLLGVVEDGVLRVDAHATG